MKADFINLCEHDKSLSKEFTKYNSEGAAFLLGTVEVIPERKFVIEQEKVKIDKPQLTTNRVSNNEGIYSLSMESTQEETIELFGTPSFIFNFNENATVLAYGRNHWFYFLDNKLVKATTKNQEFTYELVNKIPFENRFDNIIWAINDELKKGDKRDQIEPMNQIDDDSTRLNLLWSSYTHEENELIGFELNHEDVEAVSFSALANDSRITYDDTVDAFLSTQSLNQFIEKAKGEILINSGTQRYIYDHRMTFDVTRNQLRKIGIGDNLYKTDSKSEAWRFSRYYQGQSLDDAIANTSQPYSEVSDELYINFDDYSVVLFAYNNEIYRLEVEVY